MSLSPPTFAGTTLIAAACEDKGVHIILGKEGLVLQSLRGCARRLHHRITRGRHECAVTSVCFSRLGRFLASGGSDGGVRVWASGTWLPARTIAAHRSAVRDMAFAPDDRMFATGARRACIPSAHAAQAATTRWLLCGMLPRDAGLPPCRSEHSSH